jgi:hypothetical protein
MFHSVPGPFGMQFLTLLTSGIPLDFSLIGGAYQKGVKYLLQHGMWAGHGKRLSRGADEMPTLLTSGTRMKELPQDTQNLKN